MSEALLVKVGGSLRGAEALLEELAAYPGPLVLVHGGGPEIGEWLKRLGYESRFVGAEGHPPGAVGGGGDGPLPHGEAPGLGAFPKGKEGPRPLGAGRPLPKGRALPELGRVGEVVGVEVGLLLDLLEKGYTPFSHPSPWTRKVP